MSTETVTVAGMSTASRLSLAACAVYCLLLFIGSRLSGRSSHRVKEKPQQAPDLWVYFVPLLFVLAIINFQWFFRWLPQSDRGRTLLVKYLLYKISMGRIIISTAFSARVYSYLFSTGSQLMMVILSTIPLGYLAHNAVCRRYPHLHRLDLDGFFFLYPALCILAVFHISPVFYSFVLSLHSGPAQDIFQKFVGLDHYRALMHDPTFWTSLRNTAWFAFGSVPLTIACSLFIAVLLNQKIKGLSFYRTVYFLPVITSVAAVSLVWRWVYHPQRGVLNKGLEMLGFSGLNWLYEPRGIFDMMSQSIAGFQCSVAVKSAGMWLFSSAPEPVLWIFRDALPGLAAGPSLAITAIIIMSVWKGLGYNVIIFLAGLQNIPGELYDAARIDGAGVWDRFRNITWPLLSPTTYFVLIMSTISSFQVFAQIFMLYAGNATDGSRVVVYYLFEKGFQTFEFGYASALAYVLFLIIFVMTFIQRRFVGARVHYD